MKKLLIVGLLLVSSPAWAEWEKVFEDDNTTEYIDSPIRAPERNRTKVWQMKNLKQRDEYGIMSIRTRFEYDCKEERRRILSMSSHSEPMAGGKTIDRASDPVNWQDMPPGTVGDKILKQVCDY